jgi:hypothetical protein
MNIRWFLFCLAGLMVIGASSGYAAAPSAAATEAYYIVKVQDMAKASTTKVMSAAEFKELEKTIQQENQYFPQAVAAAAKAWREDDGNKGSAFAGTRVSPRKIVGAPERFSSQAKAQEKLTAMDELESKKADREFAKTKNSKAVKKSKEEIARESKKEADTFAAMELIQKKLAEIIAAKAAPAAGAAAPKAPDAAAKEAGQKAL